jgi:serine/threonine-protein kinase HipA
MGLRFSDAAPDRPAGRLAMAGHRAALEWGPEVIADRLLVDPLLYPPEPGLQVALRDAFSGLHGFLADSLPEGWGVLLMQRRLARAGIRWDGLSAVDRLALVGVSGRGALVFEPATTPDDPAATLDLDELASESRTLLTGGDSALADTLARLGGASGGARPKIHAGFAPDGRISLDEGEAPPGFTSWIVKFSALADPVDIGPVEQAYAAMARAAGVVMAQTRLIPAARGPGYFATIRFDRPAPGRRLHMVSLAGAVEAPSHLPSLGYDGFLRATRAITRHEGDVVQAFTRMVFNVLACNRDDHTRQHAYLMDDAGQWRLAPAYDLTWSEGAGGEHMLSIEGERRSPTRAHVETLGRRHGIPLATIDAIIDRVRASAAQWRDHAEVAEVGVSTGAIAARLAAIDRNFNPGYGKSSGA